MPAKVTQLFPETALERILEALEGELVEATDEEILAAAHHLGMKPEMKGSAAFLGLRYPAAQPAPAPRRSRARPAGRKLRPPKEPTET